MLLEAGCTKLNFAGGEPFLAPAMLLGMASYARASGLYTSVITNGLLAEPSDAFDMMGVSVDSFNPETNRRIGRATLDVDRLRGLREGSRAFKLNTVVSSLNLGEDFNARVDSIDPARWKLFQVLTVEDQNAGHGTEVSDAEFATFARRHPRAIPESNSVMANSYLVLDEKLRFLDGETKRPIGPSILEDPGQVAAALARLDEASFLERAGDFYSS